MQKPLLLLLFAAMLTSLVSAQTPALQAKWTDDHRVVLEALPAPGQPISLPVTTKMRKEIPDLKATCEKMSNSISTWRISDDGSNFIVTLGRDYYPQWTQKDWELYIYRVSGVYLVKG